MSIRLRCPNGHTLEAPDRFAGTVMECPMCGADIQIGALPPVAALVAEPPPAPAAVPVAQAVEEELPELIAEVNEIGPPGPRRRRRRPPAPRSATISEKMHRVNLGLTFFYIKFIIIVVALLLDILTQIGVAVSKSPDGGAFFSVLKVMALLVQTCLGLVGAVFLCFVPRKSRLRPLAITSASLEGASVLFMLLGFIFLFAGPQAGTVMVLLGVLAALAGWVTFMIFLSSLARYLDDEPTAAEIMQLMYMVIAVFGGLIIVGMSFGMALRGSPIARALVILFLALFAVVFQVKFLLGMLQVLGTMRQQIASRW